MDMDKSMNPRVTPMSTHVSAQDLNDILHGEISAVEAYKQVSEKVKDDPEAYRLREFRNDHDEAVRYWTREAKNSGTEPTGTSSVWGTVVETFVGLSKLVGEQNALRALKKGEEHGLSEYKSMLDGDTLTLAQKEQVRRVFIPRQQSHIESINALLKVH